jgi:hypothetical protein
MQEEVEGRTVNLAISTSKLTARTVVMAVRTYMNHRRTKIAKGPEGKQKVKDLIGQDQGVTNIDISKTDLKGFERVARKYGIDYAIRKDASVEPPKYLVFFKAKDADAMTAAFNEYSHRALKKEERPSVLEQIRKLKEIIASLPGRVISREKQREHSR